MTPNFITGLALAAVAGGLWELVEWLLLDHSAVAIFWSDALAGPVMLFAATLCWKPWRLSRLQQALDTLGQDCERLQKHLQAANVLRKSVAASSIPFVRLDNEGNGVEINQAAIRCLTSSGWSEFLGLELGFRSQRRHHPALVDAQSRLKHKLKAVSSSNPQAFEWRVVTPAGEQEIFHVVAGALGRPLGGWAVIFFRRDGSFQGVASRPDANFSVHPDAA